MFSGVNTYTYNILNLTGNSSSVTTNKFYVSDTTYSYGGHDFDLSGPLFASSTLTPILVVTANDFDVSAIADGLNNIALCLIDLPAASYPFVTILFEQPNGMSCAAIAAAYGGTLYLDYQDYLVANGNANYSVANVPGLTIHSGHDPAYLRFETTTVNTQNYAPIKISSGSGLVKGNTIYNSYYPLYYSLINADSNEEVYLNNFYYAGIQDTGSGNSYCVGNEGNFYGDGVKITPEDCGPTNISIPPDGEALLDPDNEVTILWTKQSSIHPISYLLEYKLNNDTTWKELTTTTGLSFVWNYSNIPPILNSTNSIMTAAKPMMPMTARTPLPEVAVIWLLVTVHPIRENPE